MSCSGPAHSVNCLFCTINVSKYTCPRCNAKYCGLDCYRCDRHRECSEQFYKNCVIESLQELNSSKSEQHKIHEVLQNLQSEFENQEDLFSLSERISGIDLDDTDSVLRALTLQEKQQFDKLLTSGNANSIIELWEPWWNVKMQLVTFDDAHQANVPAVLESIPELKTLLSRPAAPSVQLSVLNVLYAFAYTARLFNGDLYEDPSDSVACVLNLSKALDQSAFDSVQSAIASTTSAVANAGVFSRAPAFQAAILRDVIALVSNDKLHTLRALSELHRVLKAARKGARKHPTTGSDFSKHRLFLAQKKLEFLLAWSVQHSGTLMELVPEVEAEFCRMSSELAQHARLQKDIEQNMQHLKPKKKELIQEISD